MAKKNLLSELATLEVEKFDFSAEFAEDQTDFKSRFSKNWTTHISACYM